MTDPAPITMFHTYVSPSAIDRVVEVLRSGWLNEGAVVREFEVEAAKKLGVANPVALNSGTSALHLALILSGVGPGDEVILPAQTFIATGLAILMQRAVPVFADIDPFTGNLSAEAIRSAITLRSKAIIPVHWGGYPCDLDEINAIADRHGLTVIEDAAHALGAIYKGKPIGSVSRFTAFSFQAIKHLTTGDGGLLCALDQADAQGARVRRWFGIDRTMVQRSQLGERGIDISVVGYKYHMNNIAAALGLGNLLDFPQRLLRRQQLGSYYQDQLAGIPGLELLHWKADRTHAFWVFTVRVERRADFVRALAGRGIQTSVVDLRIDRNSVFAGYRSELPGQTDFDQRQVALPVHEGLSDGDVGRIIAAVKEGW